MQVTGFNGFLFSTIGVKARTAPDLSPGPNRNQTEQPRLAGDPLVPQVLQAARIETILFTVPNGAANQNEPTMQAILARLAIDDPSPPKKITGLLADGTTAVEAYGHATNWRIYAVNQLAVDFAIQTGGWRQTADTTLQPATSFNANTTISMAAQTGGRDVYPKILAYWLGVQRATPTATFGHKHRLGSNLTITNNGSEPIRNQPYHIGPIDTATLVTAGQLKSNGDDLRIYCEGKELLRNLVGINTRTTYVWIVLPDIEPGQTITLEILINNPNATNPGTLTYSSSPALPAMDIGGTSFNPSASTIGSITIAGSPWEVNQWAGGTVSISNAAGTGAHGQIIEIASNTANVLTLAASLGAAPLTTDTVVIMRSGPQAHSGKATAATASTISDGLKVWTSKWINGRVKILTGTGAGQVRNIASANTFQLGITPNWGTTPDTTSVYVAFKPNALRLWNMPIAAMASPHKGLWAQNKSQAPPTQINFDAPASWYRFTFLRNDDSYSQPRTTPVDLGGGNLDWFALPYMQRSRKGRAQSQKEVGIADSIAVYSPFTIKAVYLPLATRNAKKAGSGVIGEGMVEAQLLLQEAGGEAWSQFFSDKTVNNSITNLSLTLNELDLTSYSQPNRIAANIIPNNGDTIPENDNNTALLCNDQSSRRSVQLWVAPEEQISDSYDWFSAPPAAVAIYDVWLRFTNKGAAPTRPYNQLEVGGSGRRVFIANNTERISIDCEAHRATIVDNTGAKIRDAQWAIQPYEVVDDPDGAAYTRVDARWLPIPKYPGSAATDVQLSDPSGATWGAMTIQITGRLGYLI